MKAIIETSGKQYLIENKQIIFIDKINKNVGGKIIFDKILMIDGTFGKPYIKNAKVEGIIEKHGKQKKIIVFTYKPKKNTKRKLGHRQEYTRVKITKILKK